MTMMSVGILGTGSALPSRRVSTRELLTSLLPGAPIAEIEERIGIHNRHWLGPGESAASLATGAISQALARAGMAAQDLRRIILVSSTGGDHLIPATATDVANALGTGDACDAFDISNACVGFLSGLDVATRSVATGLGPVAVVAVETFSRALSPNGRRAYLVLGDAAAGAIVGPARNPQEGMLASVLGTSSRLKGKMVMPHHWQEGGRPHHDFDAPSAEITDTAITLIERAVGAALDAAHLSLADIDWVLPHQPNGEIFGLLRQRLGFSEDRAVPVYPEAGSLGAAAVPLSLDRLLRDHDVRPGARILLTAVGSGTACAAMIYQVAP